MSKPLFVRLPGSDRETDVLQHRQAPVRDFELWLEEDLSRLESRYDHFVTRRSLRRYLLGDESSSRSRRRFAME